MPFNSKVSTSKKGENLSSSSQSSNIQLKVSNHPEAIIQRVRGNPQSLTHSDTIVLQRTIGNQAVCQLMKEIGIVNSKPVQKKENATGLPDGLKAGVESMSGLSMDSVRVHYNSSKPAQVGALAYTQGADIHVAPGQERHLPHEAWHVVQQAEGRVKPTLQMKGVQVNDDVGLEREADLMGGKASNYSSVKPAQESVLVHTHGADMHVVPGQERHSPHVWMPVIQQFQNRVIQKYEPLIDPHTEADVEHIEELSRINEGIVESEGYELKGLHGTNIEHAKSILEEGIRIREDLNTSQVDNEYGTGFYVDTSKEDGEFSGSAWAFHSAILAAYGKAEDPMHDLSDEEIMKQYVELEKKLNEHTEAHKNMVGEHKGTNRTVILKIWERDESGYNEGTDFNTYNHEDQIVYTNTTHLLATIYRINVEEEAGY